MTRNSTTCLRWSKTAKLSYQIFSVVGFGMTPKYVNSLKASHQDILWVLQCSWLMVVNKYALSTENLKV